MGYEQADKCMECGYCEHVCPSRDITLTPRQRLQARRIIARTGSKELEKEYRYIGAETCCADGSCMMPCPMGINTGTVTDKVRILTNPGLFDKALSASAGHYGTVETAIRGVLRAAVATQKIVSPYPLIWASDFLHRLYNQTPHWSRHFPKPPALKWTENDGTPDYIYFPACVTRIFGGSSTGKDDLITVVMRLAERAGKKMALPRDMHGLCCSQIWEHKGDPEGQRRMAAQTVEAFYRLTHQGKVPVVCDTTSCTHSALTGATGRIARQGNSRKMQKSAHHRHNNLACRRNNASSDCNKPQKQSSVAPHLRVAPCRTRQTHDRSGRKMCTHRSRTR